MKLAHLIDKYPSSKDYITGEYNKAREMFPDETCIMVLVVGFPPKGLTVIVKSDGDISLNAQEEE